jgi:hypothetical protein
MVDGGTMMVTGGTRSVDGSTLTVGGDTHTSDDQHRLGSVVASTPWLCRYKDKQHPHIC